MELLDKIEVLLTGNTVPIPNPSSVTILAESESRTDPLNLIAEYRVQLRICSVIRCREKEKDSAIELTIQNINDLVYGEIESDLSHLMSMVYNTNNEDAINKCKSILDKVRFQPTHN